MNVRAGDRVVVVGPEGSAQKGRAGVVRSLHAGATLFPPPPKQANDGPKPPPPAVVAEVLLDGEARPRNFAADNLRPE